MGKYQVAKKTVREYMDAMGSATPETVLNIIKDHVTENYNWKGVYPFREITKVEDVVEKFWKPILGSFTRLQRREDIFIGGTNDVTGKGQWIMSMGHFMGLFDKEFLGIRPTGKMTSIRYAEFSKVEDGKITETGLFLDLLGVMDQAGVYPLPQSTGQYFVYPGPRNHSGRLLEDAPEQDGVDTMALVNKMVADLTELNESGAMGCPPEVLEKSWSKDMIWYGPCGIGASYTIPRYQVQHQLPFRNNLEGKKFNGHVARFAEGDFACFFGWPNLTNTPVGGFLGLPGGKSADMQVVDVYCRIDDKLVENWVLIDIPYWLQQQGIDVFKRTQEIMNPSL